MTFKRGLKFRKTMTLYSFLSNKLHKRHKYRNIPILRIQIKFPSVYKIVLSYCKLNQQIQKLQYDSILVLDIKSFESTCKSDVADMKTGTCTRIRLTTY